MRFFPIFAAAMLALVSAPAARADEKSDAILKEVRLRAVYRNAYSVTIEGVSKQDKVRIRIWHVRPDRYRLETTHRNQTLVVIWDGKHPVLVDDGRVTPLPSKTVVQMKGFISLFTLFSGNFPTANVKSTYVTQKILDETTVVDVIDIVNPIQDSARYYIDNNSCVRKIVVKGVTLTLLNFIQDEPIPDEKFAIPKSK